MAPPPIGCRLSATAGRSAKATATSLDLSAGRWSAVRVRLPATITRGPLPIRLVATDAAGNRSVLSRRVGLLT